MPLTVVLSNSGETPIYEQIVDQVTSAITSGELAEGEALPSLRTLAKNLRVSVITTTRAYTELTHQGLIATVPGKGAFVKAANTELLRERHLAELESHLVKAIAVAKRANISARDVHDALHAHWTLDEEDAS